MVKPPPKKYRVQKYPKIVDPDASPFIKTDVYEKPNKMILELEGERPALKLTFQEKRKTLSYAPIHVPLHPFHRRGI